MYHARTTINVKKVLATYDITVIVHIAAESRVRAMFGVWGSE